MAQQTINLGAVAGDDTGDDLRTGGQKINDNFTELYAGALDLAQVRTVSKGAFGFTSIQDAIDDIADADAAKPYVVYVYPGIYNEQVTMKPYVSVVGVDRTAVMVTHTGDDDGTIIGSSHAQIMSLTVLLSEIDTEWGILCTDPVDFAIRNVTVRPPGDFYVDYPESSNGIGIIGYGENLLIDGCSVWANDSLSTVSPIDINLFATDPIPQYVVISNTMVGGGRAAFGIRIRNTYSEVYLKECSCDLLGLVVDSAGLVHVTGCSFSELSVTDATILAASLSLSNVPTIGTGGALWGPYTMFRGVGTSGGVIQSIVTVASTYTAIARDEIICADASGGAFTVTLPTAVGFSGKVFTVKRLNSGANAVTVGTLYSQTIDGSTTYVLSAQYASITVVSNGANWHIIGKV